MSSASTSIPRFAIIGAGMSGLGAAARLKQRLGSSVEVTLFELAPSWGGTWFYNKYPGIACDSPAHVYSFSFFRKANWKRHYAKGGEVFEYFTELVDAHNLRPSIKLRHEVTAARFDSHNSVWTLSFIDHTQGEAAEVQTAKFNFVIMATGAQRCLIQPKEFDDFTGQRTHTARWDPRIDVAGKNVAVVGVGASAAQVIPSIQPLVKSLHVYQRTPQWVFPRPDQEFSSWTVKLFTWFPLILFFYRAWIVFKFDVIFYRAFMMGHPLARMFTSIAQKHINRTFGIADPIKAVPSDVLAMTPQYPVGCKRIIVSSIYYDALVKPNVTMHYGSVQGIDNGTAILSEETDQTTGGKVVKSTDIDVLIMATGFDYQQWMRPLRVVGTTQKDLSDSWSENMESYYGLATTGYPNAFSLLGPGTRPGHTGLCAMVEAQVEHIVDIVQYMQSKRLTYVEVKAEAQRKATQKVIDGMEGTVFGAGCAGWYRNDSGKVTMIWPKTCRSYKQQLSEITMSDWTFS
ncbi:hypothetical protein BOTBODRAFT_27386 [Botryobasidium botryosum FD-172 SS1]|uniref:Uncharacterized protein n=1 Tax=Botryobasidium botryosum (strain FD-172 SS1) TaxID=930990 RepID=A0A067MZ50_BOTB1|nr:hypothetical protein BOTBODRAFT_27386 [Botryobasidium botryosum FD-172 SS1]